MIKLSPLSAALLFSLLFFSSLVVWLILPDDEIDPQLDLIKGLGGSLLREKIVAASSSRFVIIGDQRKIVDHLGSEVPLPVEIIPAWGSCSVLRP